MTETTSDVFAVQAGDRVIAAARAGQQQAAALVNEGFDNTIAYFEALRKVERPSDFAAVNLDLVKKTVNTLSKSVETMFELAADRARPASATV